MVTVAVDAMGGERAPDEIVQGVAALSLAAENVGTVLVGDERQITDILGRLPHNPERIEVVHAGGSLPRTSVFAAVSLLAEGRADAAVSAGSAADALAACREKLPLIEGVTSPALSAVYPTALRRGRIEDPFSLLLDVGATLDPTPEELCAFAALGSSYARAVSRNQRPRVALLSIDDDPTRGLPALVEAHARLRALPGIEFIGNLEAVDLPEGRADVVVSGGFVGNVVVTMLDGVAELVVDLASYAQKQKLLWRVGAGLLTGGLAQLKHLTDWEQYGGAPLLGYQKLVLRAHPRSGAQAIQNACRVAAKAVAADVPAGFAEIWRARAPLGKTA